MMSHKLNEILHAVQNPQQWEIFPSLLQNFSYIFLQPDRINYKTEKNKVKETREEKPDLPLLSSPFASLELSIF